ncbi:MAG: DUF1214 domain-containing protein [Deltaproteobacteria bacterium]|nr:DUF1214 domain-containing protein [Deltaproteobacteria bacterium]
MSDPVESRQAFRDFLALLEQVDGEFLGEARGVVAPADVAEGEHMLLHLIKAGIDTWVDNDAARPRFAPLASAVLKWGGEGADNPSHCAPLDPTRRYKITGRMRDEAYISFTVYTGKEEGDWNDDVVSALNHTEFARDADGRFEIEVSPTPRPGALHMQPGKPNCVISRHYFEREVCAMADPTLRCDFDIECLDEPGYSRPLPPAALADKLRAAMNFIHGQTLARKQDPSATPSWFSLVPNQLPQPEKWVPSVGGGAGAVDNAYCAGLVVLQPEEALIVEARWPECVYANVMFWNRFLQTGDYRYRSCSLNRKQMQADAEGRFAFVVAHRDPGVPNWIDTEGHPAGTLYWRFLLPEGKIEQPRCRVVPLADAAQAIAEFATEPGA